MGIQNKMKNPSLLSYLKLSGGKIIHPSTSADSYLSYKTELSYESGLRNIQNRPLLFHIFLKTFSLYTFKTAEIQIANYFKLLHWLYIFYRGYL